jgi:DNA-binding NarL/FixJ family response regulator
LDGIHEIAATRSGTFVLGPKVRDRCCVAGTASVPALADPPSDGGQPVTLLSRLTPRELDILRLIGRGMARGEIAKQLCRSVKTIDGHQDRMAKKLGVASRSDLLRLAIREGLALP